MGFIDKVKKTHQNTSSGWYQLFIGIYYPMKYFGSRVWLAKLLLLPQLFAVFPVSEGKTQACILRVSHNLSCTTDSLGSLR